MTLSATAADGHDDDRRAPLGAAYWRLWSSSALSNLADGVFKVALPLVAVRLTRSPTLIAGLTFAITLPWLVFALPAGALADRLDRRRVMLGANTLRALLLTILVGAALFDVGLIWLLYVVALGVGVTETLYDTSAQAILPQVVARRQLSRANGRLYAAEMTANEFVGPPLGGLLVATGVAIAFGIPSALWLAAVLALLLVPGAFRVERPERTSLRADIVEGLRFLWRQRVLRTLALMTGGFNFASNATFAILVLYAVGPESAMGLSEPQYGLLLTGVAAGSLVGSLAAEHVERYLGRARSLAVALVAGSLTVATPGLTTHPLAIAAAFFVGGIGIITANVIIVSLRQQITPDRLLGRVNSAYRLFGWGSRPLGAAAGGLLAQVFGLRPVFLLMGIVALSLLVGMRVVTEEALDAAGA